MHFLEKWRWRYSDYYYIVIIRLWRQKKYKKKYKRDIYTCMPSHLKLRPVIYNWSGCAPGVLTTLKEKENVVLFRLNGIAPRGTAANNDALYAEIRYYTPEVNR